MGKRGPKSASSKVYPSKRAEERPKPPVGMALRPRRIWKELVASLPADHFRPADYPLLRAYCEAEALHFEASEQINQVGAVIPKLAVLKRDGGQEVVEVGVKTNPYVAIQTQAAHTMAQLATKLRLAVNARAPGAGGGPARSNYRRSGLLYGEDEWPPR